MPAIMPAMSSLPPPEPATALPLAPMVRATQVLAVGSLLALIVLGLAWELWLAPTGGGSLAFKVLPLTVPLAGLLKHRLYTYRWLSLLVWLYFTEGVVRATSESGLGARLALLEVLLCLVLFAACAVQVRWRLKHRLAAPDDAAAAVDAAADAGRP
jgi:uncharacterized membrane protein